MSFDKKHYREIKKFVAYNLNHPSILADVKCPFDWAKSFFPLVTHSVNCEDFEGAKATRDAIIEFLNTFCGDDPIPETALLKLPEHIEDKLSGIVCT